MKRVIFAIVALAAVAVGCTTNEMVGASNDAIAFENAFVENGTKATDNFTLTAATLGSFEVWGTTQRPGSDTNPHVAIFNGATVESTDGGLTWGYADNLTQYWLPGNNYHFVAVKNATVTERGTNNLPSKIAYTYNPADKADMLYSESGTMVGKTAGGNVPVSFTFDHKLAKALFTLENTMTTNTADNLYAYELVGIAINGLPTSADYVLDGGVWTWKNHSGSVDLTFGNTPKAGAVGVEDSQTSADSHLIIPCDYTALNVCFTLNTYFKGNLVSVQEYDKNIAVEFAPGRVYNFCLSLSFPGDPIQFSVQSVNGWDESWNGGSDEVILPGF